MFLQRMTAAAAAMAAGVPLIQRWVVLLRPGRYPADVVNRAVASARGMHLEGASFDAARNEFELTKAMIGWIK